MSSAAQAAPNPLSMLTTVTPLPQQCGNTSEARAIACACGDSDERLVHESRHHSGQRSLRAGAMFYERARCITVGLLEADEGPWSVGAICAGTADLPVAEEAAVALECFGRRVERIVDVGVAGLHRILAEIDRIRSCGVVILAALAIAREPLRNAQPPPASQAPLGLSPATPPR